MTFDEAFTRLIGLEAGLTMDPRDSGNWTGGAVNVGMLRGTKYGISAATYPHLDIAHLTLEDARKIYMDDWWIKAGADQMDAAIVYQLWAFAVNAGMETSKRLLQRAVGGIAEDGRIGPMSIAAINKQSVTDVIMKFSSECLFYYTSRSGWPTFGKSWTNRTAAQLKYAAKDA